MASNDILIRKFEINETKINKSKSSILYEVTYTSYRQNLLDSDEKVIVWKRFKDFERLYYDLQKLRLALYIKDPLPPFPDTKSFKKELNQEELEERRKSALDLLEYIAKHPCFYKNKIFKIFFEESELKVEKQICLKENQLANQSKINLMDTENLIDSNQNFPIPFQYLNSSDENQTKLDKKFKPIASSSTKSDLDNSNICYLVDACHLVCQGQLNEEKQEYESAFESYKCAISILLKGVQHEKDRTKKLNVRKMVEKYLSKAEEIYDQHLIKEERSGSKKFSLDTPYKQMMMMNDVICKEKNILSKFKLLSISSKVQIVYDLNLNEKFAIKVVHKISNLNGHKQFFVFPKRIPNMVQLFKIYENDYAYFLILEYFSCCKLSDILNEVRNRLNPCVECLFDSTESLAINDQVLDEELSDDIDDLEEILFDKEKFNDSEEFYLNRSVSIDDVKTLSKIEDDLLNYQNRSKLVESKSVQKLSGLTHSESNEFNQKATSSTIVKTSNTNSTKSPFNTLTGIFDKARNLLKNVDQTIRNTSIDQARLSVNNIDLQCNLNNYILERINDKLLNVYYCDRHLNKQLNDCKIEGKVLFKEETVKKWLFQIVTFLENLHDQGLLYINLNPSKILISDDLQDVCLAYKYSLDYKKICLNENFDLVNISQLIVSSFYSTYSSSFEYSYYVAPELIYYYNQAITSAIDYWSLGVLAYELLTNKPLSSFIPSINSKNLIKFPDFLSLEAKDLIENLLKINPVERLNCDSIKCHSFFKPL